MKRLNIVRRRTEFVKLKFDAPTTDVSVHLLARNPGSNTPPHLVVESVETDKDYQKIQDVYVNGPLKHRIENLLVLRWSLKFDTETARHQLHCKLEQYRCQKDKGFEGCLGQVGNTLVRSLIAATWP